MASRNRTSGTPSINLRNGGVPVWAQTVERGTLLNVGVAPGFFSASERGAEMLRALTQYAAQRAGRTFTANRAILRLKRGRYTIVRTFNESATVEGRTINLFLADAFRSRRIGRFRRVLSLCSWTFPKTATPHVAFVSGRVYARLETAQVTRFFVRGPGGTTGAARIASHGKKLDGVRATDWIGRPVAVREFVENGSVLVEYPNHPDGVIVYVGWR